MSILEKVKALFTEANPESAQATFVDVKANDGAVLLRITGDIAIDSAVQVINEDGSLADAQDGEFKLEDGTSITVLAGKISEVATATEEATDAAEGEAASVETVNATAETTVEMAEGDIKPDGEAPASEEIASNLEERVTALESRISELIDMVKGMHSDMSTEKVTLETEIATLKTKNEELSKVNAAPEVNFKKVEKMEKEYKSLSLVEKVMRMKEQNQ
tara:strand:- start:186 stop:842 length:657 start_codon:yes stop_codon:yes gene_type:complete